jgi:uncharacterized protein YaaR (DUF327 family)
VRGDQLVVSSPAQALKEYTTAIEAFLAIASDKLAPAAQRSRCRAACEQLMTKAEKLKREISERNEKLSRRQSAARSSIYRKRTSRYVAPIYEEKLSIKEETILLKSSKINGGKYPPLKSGVTPIIPHTTEVFT